MSINIQGKITKINRILKKKKQVTNSLLRHLIYF